MRLQAQSLKSSCHWSCKRVKYKKYGPKHRFDHSKQYVFAPITTLSPICPYKSGPERPQNEKNTLQALSRKWLSRVPGFRLHVLYIGTGRSKLCSHTSKQPKYGLYNFFTVTCPYKSGLVSKIEPFFAFLSSFGRDLGVKPSNSKSNLSVGMMRIPDGWILILYPQVPARKTPYPPRNTKF